MVEARSNASQVTDTISIGVLKRAGIDLIDDAFDLSFPSLRGGLRDL
jgi:hypothetical protein